MPGWKSDLIEVADAAWTRFLGRIDGLSDEEYFWEPAPLCWSVRRTGDGGVHRGDWGMTWWATPPPFTTIAWRIGHIVDNLSDPRIARQLGYAPVRDSADGLPAHADDARSRLESAFATVRGYLCGVPEDSLGEPMGEVAGRWADSDRGALILHVLDELIHHGAEVAVLRDLYRATHPAPAPLVVALLDGDRAAVDLACAEDPDALGRLLAHETDLLVRATELGRWSAIPLLSELGFPLTLPDGRSGLHHAAAAGALVTVRFLVSAGADVDQRDPSFQSTPLGWAEYFSEVSGQPKSADIQAVIEFLRPLTRIAP